MLPAGLVGHAGIRESLLRNGFATMRNSSAHGSPKIAVASNRVQIAMQSPQIELRIALPSPLCAHAARGRQQLLMTSAQAMQKSMGYSPATLLRRWPWRGPPHTTPSTA